MAFQFKDKLSLPVVGAPLFIVSNPALVIAQCKAGIVGSFPALNARPPEVLEHWLQQITDELDRHNQEHPDQPAAPYAVNQIVHPSNTRLERDLELCVKYQVPILITSLGAREEVNQAAHSYGGIALHDVINNEYARKAIAKGADGLIAVAAGAGGHGGSWSPFALIQEIREWFDGLLLLSGSIANGRAILAARILGADLAYIGSPFIATHEANAVEAYKQMLVDSSAADLVYTNSLTGVYGNFLRPSIINAGLDPEVLKNQAPGKMLLDDEEVKVWKSIWSCGHGIGAVKEVVSTAALVDRLKREYGKAKLEAKRLLAQ